MAWYNVGIAAASMLANVLMKSKGSGGGAPLMPPAPSKQLTQIQPYLDSAQQVAQYTPQGANWGPGQQASPMAQPTTQSILGNQAQTPSIYESIMKQWGQ